MLSRLPEIAAIVTFFVSIWSGTARAEMDGPVCFEKFGSQKLTVTAVPDPFTVQLSDGALISPVGFYLPTWLPQDALNELHRSIQVTIVGKKLQAFQTSQRLDRYGRKPAYLAFDDGRSLAAELLFLGQALLAPSRGLPCLETLEFAERRARQEKRGLWAGDSLFDIQDPALNRLVGHYATLRGRVRSVGVREKRHYLNFGTNWSEDFTAELAPSTTKRLFGNSKNLQKLDGQWVTVRGRLRNKGGPMIVIEQKGQIDFPTDTPEQD